jgi:hypothetical protein
MTNINGVERVVYVQPQERKGKHTALRHVGNAAVTAAGVVGTGKLVAEGVWSSNQLLHNDMLDSGLYLNPRYAGPRNYISKFTTKIHRAFQSIGQKIFKSPHDEGVISKMYGLSKRSAAYPTKLKFAKGKLAMGIAAVVTALAFVAHGIYKAGKINGEAQ